MAGIVRASCARPCRSAWRASPDAKTCGRAFETFFQEQQARAEAA